MISLGEILFRLRKENGLSQQQLGDLLGVSDRQYANIEKGRSDASATQLTLLADHFNVSLDYLVGRSDDRGTVLQVEDDEDDDFEYAALDGRPLSEEQIKVVKQIVKDEIAKGQKKK